MVTDTTRLSRTVKRVVIMTLSMAPAPGTSPSIAYHILPEAEWLFLQSFSDDRGNYTDPKPHAAL